MGERWKIDGRQRGGCGPGMPGPYGGERKIVGRACPQAAAGVYRCRMISGHLCRGAASSTCRGGVKTPPYGVG